MDSNDEAKKIEQEMNETLKSIQALEACFEGSLKENAKTKYVKKDSSVSKYPTTPILQYHIGPKKRGYRRIPASMRLGICLKTASATGSWPSDTRQFPRGLRCASKKV